MKLITTLIALLAVYELAFGKENSKTVTKLFDKENKCIMDRKKGLCNNELGNSGNIERKLKSFGPKFQKVHLQLPRINPIRTGHVRNINIIEGRTHTMKTLAIHPPIFEIKEFLSSDECDAIIELAEEKGLKEPSAVFRNLKLPEQPDHSAFDKWDWDLDGSLSSDEVSSIDEIKHLLFTKDDFVQMCKDLGFNADENGKISYGELERVTFKKFKEYFEQFDEGKANATVHGTEETWLWHDEDELLVYEDVLENYHQRLSNLTRIPKKLIEESEPLQITKFQNGSFTECRHDSDQSIPSVPCCIFGSTTNCRVCRFISIMYFLNDGSDGEVLFPLADNKTYSWDDLHGHTSKVCSKTPNISRANLIIKPDKGKAIMWYNHYIGRDTGWMSSVDPLSFYGTNKVGKTEKWTATQWVNIVGDGVHELRPWRMGSNWLSDNNKKEDVIEQMRNDDFIEGEIYLHDAKLIAIDDRDNRSNDDKDNHSNDGKDNRSNDDRDNRSNEDENGESKKYSSDELDNLLKKNAEVDEKSSKHKKSNEKAKARYEQTEKLTKTAEGRREESKTKSNKNELNSNRTRNRKEEQIGESNLSNEKEMNPKKSKAFEGAKQEQTENVPSNKRNRSPERGEGPLGPPIRGLSQKAGKGLYQATSSTPLPYVLPSGKMIDNKIIVSVLMLIDELSRDELEVVARSLHEKLQLACIPIMVNPIGPI